LSAGIADHRKSLKKVDVITLNFMQIMSSAFAPSQTIPKTYTQFAENISPPLTFRDIPQGTISLVLLMEDPDVPAIAGVPVWDHWVLFNISPLIVELPENAKGIGTLGKNTRGGLAYSGPRPPDREHRYFFRLYALDTMLSVPAGSTKEQVIDAMNGHVLTEAELIGLCAPM